MLIARRTAVSALSIFALGTAALAAPPAAQASTRITCKAHASPSSPKKYSYLDIVVHTRAHAYVRATAHYKTTNTTHARHANSKGTASIPFYISGATAGRRVPVSVTARGAHHTASCSTGFTPHR